MPQCSTIKSVHRHKAWRGLPERKLSVTLIPGLGFAAVDQAPQMQLRSINTRSDPVGDHATSGSASCFHHISRSRALTHRSVLQVGKCCYRWRNLAPCRPLMVAPVFLLAHAPSAGQKMRLQSLPRGSFLAHRNAEGLRGPTGPSLRIEAPFPLDMPVVAERRLCEAWITAVITAWLW